MIGVILAAGMAKRLRPLTDERPKCLLKVGERTLLQRTVDAMLDAGIRELVVVTGYRANMIRDFPGWCSRGKGLPNSSRDSSLAGLIFTFYLKISFIFGCAGSLLPRAGLLQLRRVGATLLLQCTGSVVAAGAIFSDQGSNPCTLHWQMDSYPLDHQRSPWLDIDAHGI